MNPKHILISRTDKIGDVILTLPVAGVLKNEFPGIKISFLGNTYTEAIIKNCTFIDQFYNWDEIKIDAVSKFKEIAADIIIHVFPNKQIADAAKRAAIKVRIGTSHRIFHWWTCNKMVNLGRKNSNLHEAQLNLQLLKPLNIKTDYNLHELPQFYGWKKSNEKDFHEILQKDRFNLILHTKSKGSAREWPLKNFYLLAIKLQKLPFNIILSGTKEEGELIEKECPELLNLEHVKNLTGTLSLSSFVDFIKEADGLIACSTGPLHIAAASGIFALGLYPPVKPMHPGRWGPLGRNATYLVKDISCSRCKISGDCACLNEISPDAVLSKVLEWNTLHNKKASG